MFNNTRWQATDPLAGLSLHATFASDQRTFRFRNDDGDEVTATWKAAENTSIEQIIGDIFRLRIAVQETAGGGSNNQTIELQSNVNNEGWFTVGPTSSRVRLGASPHVDNGTPTTRQLTGTSGTFLPGILVTTTSGTNISFTGGEHTEIEWSSLIVEDGSVPAGSIVQFRAIVNGIVTDTATSGTPTITAINRPAPTGTPTVTSTTTASSVNLQWSAVANAPRYEVERDGVVIRTDVTSTSFTDTGLNPETTYTYRVRAANASGPGPWSTAVGATTEALKTYTDFSEYPTGVMPDDWHRPWRAELTWTVEDDAGSIGGKRISTPAHPTGGGKDILVWDSFGVHTDTDITTEFVAMAGADSGDKNGIVARVSGDAGVVVYAQYVAPQLIRMLNWTGPTAQTSEGIFEIPLVDGVKYRLRLQLIGATARAKIWRAADVEPVDWGITYTNAPVREGYVGLYTYGASSSWDTFAQTVADLPVTDAPTITVDDITDDRVAGSCSVVANADTYEWQRDGVTFATDNTRTFSDEGLEPNTTYTYRVRGINDAGAGPWSAEQSVTTLPPPLAPASYSVDWSGTAALQIPAGWVKMWDPNHVYDYHAVDGNTYSSGKAVVLRNFTAKRYAIGYTDIGEAVNQDVRARIMVDSNYGNFARVMTRVSGAAATENCIMADFFVNSADSLQYVGLRAYINGTLGNFATAIRYNFNVLTWYNVQLYSAFDEFGLKVWKEGEAEPAEWTLHRLYSTGADPMTTPGYVGFGGASSRINTLVDSFTIGVDGEPAPALPAMNAAPVYHPETPAISTTIQGQDVQVSWNAVANADGYKLFRNGMLILDTTATSYLDVAPGVGRMDYTVYAYRRAV